MSFITEKLQKLSDFFYKRIMGIKTSEFITLIDITCELLQKSFSMVTTAFLSGQHAFQRLKKHLVSFIRRKLYTQILNIEIAVLDMSSNKTHSSFS